MTLIILAFKVSFGQGDQRVCLVFVDPALAQCDLRLFPFDQCLRLIAEVVQVMEDAKKQAFIEAVEKFQNSDAGRAFAESMRERREELDRWAESWRSQGVKAGMECYIVPTTLKGTLPDGKAFTLRCRYDTCWFRVGEDYWNPEWAAEISEWEFPEAGMLEWQEIADVFSRMLTLYREESNQTRGE